MADDFDVEAMLEAPYRKEDDGRHSSDSHDKDKRKKSRDHKRDRDRSSRKRRSRSRSRSRDHHSRKEHKSYGSGRSSPAKRQSRSKERKRSRSPLQVQIRKNREPESTPEERDARTVFCMQLSARIRPRDLEEFFSSVGKIRDVRLITDSKTRRSKGIAYIEFADVQSVALAMGLTNQKLLGVPIIVQASQAEKNRLAQPNNSLQKGNIGPMRLYVGSLHFNITEDMLKAIFEPFGKIEDIKLIRDHESTRSQGYGFITFKDSEDAKKALEQLNGFEVAGRPMKVNTVTERAAETIAQGGHVSLFDNDEMDRAGIDLGATGRISLMAKLAEGTGLQLPEYAANVLNMNIPQPNSSLPLHQQLAQAAAPPPPPPQQQQPTPPIATQCFMLSNMFDANTETKMNWERDISDDVILECNKHGGVLHIFVDKASPQGNVYVKCVSIIGAVSSVNALHGRYFAGKVITAAYVPLTYYHGLFPDSARSMQLVNPSNPVASQTMSMSGMGPVGMMHPAMMGHR